MIPGVDAEPLTACNGRSGSIQAPAGDPAPTEGKFSPFARAFDPLFRPIAEER